MREDYVGGLSEWCSLLEAPGDVEGALEPARALVAAEPTDEARHIFGDWKEPKPYIRIVPEPQ